jgi:hypothetical protein
VGRVWRHDLRASRRRSREALWESWLPCEKLRRATFMPASMSAPRPSTDQQACRHRHEVCELLSGEAIAVARVWVHVGGMLRRTYRAERAHNLGLAHRVVLSHEERGVSSNRGLVMCLDTSQRQYMERHTLEVMTRLEHIIRMEGTAHTPAFMSIATTKSIQAKM